MFSTGFLHICGTFDLFFCFCDSFYFFFLCQPIFYPLLLSCHLSSELFYLCSNDLFLWRWLLHCHCFFKGNIIQYSSALSEWFSCSCIFNCFCFSYCFYPFFSYNSFMVMCLFFWVNNHWISWVCSGPAICRRSVCGMGQRSFQATGVFPLIASCPPSAPLQSWFLPSQTTLAQQHIPNFKSLSFLLPSW